MSNWGTQMQQYGSLAWGMGSDQACPANTETNCIIAGSPLNVISGSINYAPLIIGTIVLSMGATPPTTLVVAARIVGAADFDSMTVSPLLMVANATFAMSFVLTGSSVRGVWNFPSGNLAISVNPTAQAVTARANGTRMCPSLIVSSDQ